MHVGLDAHKKTTTAFVVREDGKREGPFTLKTTRDGLERLAKKIGTGRMYVEASTTGKAVVRTLRELNVDAVLVNPDALLIALKRTKTDNSDAEHIAMAARMGAIKECYLPTEYEESLRCLTRRRSDIVGRLTALKKNAYAVLARNLVEPPTATLKTETSRRRWERAEGLPASERTILSGIMRETSFLQDELDAITLQIAQATSKDEDVRRLLTIPGVSIVTAAIFRAEYGEMSRFPSGKHAASYAGITPRNWQSGETQTSGSITRKGSPYLRAALVEAAHSVLRFPGEIKKKYAKHAKRLGGKKAIVAAGRRLATVVWAMLTKKRDYNAARTSLTDSKIWKHQTVALLLDTSQDEDARKLLNTHDIRKEARRLHRRYPDLPTLTSS